MSLVDRAVSPKAAIKLKTLSFLSFNQTFPHLFPKNAAQSV